MKQKSTLFNLCALAVAVVLCVISGVQFKAMHSTDALYKDNPFLTEIRKLSDYSPGLKGTMADVDVYVFEGAEPGASMLILGGTHPNETGGMLNAVVYLENVQVQAGTLYIIPQLNNLGFTATSPLRGDMDFINFTLEDGSVRAFRNGNRHSNALFQWPDPNYYDGTSGRVLKNDEVPEIRNLNRLHPGDKNGVITEQISYGVYNLIEQDDINVLYDAHEAYLRFPRLNFLIAHNNAMPLGSLAVMNANMMGFPFNVDLSGATSYGLSHRSLGDNTNTFATLFETLNPSQGTLHGKVTQDMVIDGMDPVLMMLTNQGAYEGLGGLSDTGSPIETRIGYHMVMCSELAASYTELYPETPLILSGMPTFEELSLYGVEHYLHPIH